VITVTDANNFVLYLSGAIAGLSGLTAGQYYFVSDATAGLLTSTEPTSVSSFSNPLLFALSTTTGIVLQFRPSQIDTTISFSDISGTISLTTQFATAVKNLVFSGPASGSDAVPIFRSLIGADLPTPTTTTFGGVKDIAAVSTKFVSAVTNGVPVLTQPNFTDLAGTIAAAQELDLGASATTGFFFAGVGWSNGLGILAGAAASLGAGGANVVRCLRFVISGSALTVRKITIATNGAAVAITGRIGIWNSAGTSLLVDSGSIDLNVSSGTVISQIVSSATLPPGNYILATGATNTTGTVVTVGGANNLMGLAVWNTTGGGIFNANIVRSGTAANGLSGGAFQGTLGTISTAAFANVPAVLLES
jgi:hypothetical protein